MSFFAPAFAWLFALTIPLTLFYFLKLKRRRVEVGSLLLWQRVLADQRVNSPFQRFRKHLLLLLQLLLLALIVLAAMQPAWKSSGVTQERLPVLVDVSASMGAQAAGGGKTRLEEAQARLRDWIRQLLPGQEMAVLAFGDAARQVCGFTANPRELEDAVNALKVEDVAGSLEAGLRLARAVARNHPFEEMRLLSDGNFANPTPVAVPYRIRFEQLPAGGGNAGLTACTARRDPRGTWQLLVEADATPNLAGVDCEVLEVRDGQETKLVSHYFAFDAAFHAKAQFVLPNLPATSLRVLLKNQNEDSLASDNEARMDLPELRALTAWVSPELKTVRHALRSAAGLQVFPPGKADAANPVADPASYDLLISDTALDWEKPARSKVFFGITPPDLPGLVTRLEKPGALVDWRREAPLFQHMELQELMLLDEIRYAPGQSARQAQEAGYEILAESAGGPLVLSKAEGPAHTTFLFHPDRSTLPYRVAFPILMANLLQQARESGGQSGARAWPCGTSAFRLPPSETWTVREPSGAETRAVSDASGRVTGFSARKAGNYLFLAGQQRVAAGFSLMSKQETSLSGLSEVTLGETKAKAETAPVKADRPLWRWLALAGVVLLLVEWWFFYRQPRRASGPIEV